MAATMVRARVLRNSFCRRGREEFEKALPASETQGRGGGSGLPLRETSRWQHARMKRLLRVHCNVRLFACRQSQSSLIHFHDAVETLGCAGVMSHDEHGASLVCILPQRIQNADSIIDVQIAGRFVGQQQLRFAEESTSQGHSLSLSDTQFGRYVVNAVLQPETLDQFPSSSLRIGLTVGQVGRQDVLLDVQVRNQMELLEYEADPLRRKMLRWLADSA